MELPQHCAYNQTKGCFLSLEVEAGDFTPASLDDKLSALRAQSGAGLWLTPFVGLPATGINFPIDLIYLDKDCHVIAVVESFPIFRVPPSIPPPASVLALPTHSISLTQTQRGDELLICPSEEMARLLQRFSEEAEGGEAASSEIEDLAFHSEEPASSPESESPQTPSAVIELRPAISEMPEEPEIKPKRKIARPTRGWLDRWLFPDDPNSDPDQRIAPRAPAPGLAAHFWTGGPPQQHKIRDISATGLYLLTRERWYPGTVIRVTLTKTGEQEPGAERAITVQARVVRADDDGIGLEFVLLDQSSLRRGQTVPIGEADSEQFRQFLMGLRRGNS